MFICIQTMFSIDDSINKLFLLKLILINQLENVLSAGGRGGAIATKG